MKRMLFTRLDIIKNIKYANKYRCYNIHFCTTFFEKNTNECQIPKLTIQLDLWKEETIFLLFHCLGR